MLLVNTKNSIFPKHDDTQVLVLSYGEMVSPLAPQTQATNVLAHSLSRKGQESKNRLNVAPFFFPFLLSFFLSFFLSLFLSFLHPFYRVLQPNCRMLLCFGMKTIKSTIKILISPERLFLTVFY